MARLAAPKCSAVVERRHIGPHAVQCTLDALADRIAGDVAAVVTSAHRVKDDVCFQDGLEGLNYGEWHVSFKKGEVPGLREAGPSFPGEWRTAEPLPPDKGVWYHHDDWKAAKGK